MKQKLNEYSTTITSSTGEEAFLISESYTDITKVTDAGVKSILTNTTFGKDLLKQSKEYYTQLTEQKALTTIVSTFNTQITLLQTKYDAAVKLYEKEVDEGMVS